MSNTLHLAISDFPSATTRPDRASRPGFPRCSQWLCAIGVGLALALGSMPAAAIPIEDAVKKLNAVAVYIVINDEGEPHFLIDEENPDLLILPMFMTQQQADQALENLRNANPSPKAEGSKVLPVPLNMAFSMNEKLAEDLRNEAGPDVKLVTPLVAAPDDWAKALDILVADGLEKEEVERNLQVPVFFTSPPISIQPPNSEEAKIALFFNYSQLEKAKADLPDFEGKDRVMDWRVAIDLIVKDEEDRYVFLPTESLVSTFKELRLIDPKLGEE